MANKEAYTPPASELSGYRTYVTNPDGTQPGETTTHQYPNRALPSPPWKREKPSGKPEYNTPGPSPEPPEKNLHEDKVRTKGVPGDQQEKPDTTPRITPKRRNNLDASLGRIPNSQERQNDQKGQAKKYYDKNYRTNKGRIKQRAKIFYRKNKSKFLFKKDRDLREEYPTRYDRKNKGYRDPAERTQDWRDEQKSEEKTAMRVALRYADFLYEKRPPDYPSENHYDRATKPITWDLNNNKAPAHPMNVSPTENNPGSAKVMPSDGDLVNKRDKSNWNKTALIMSEILESCSSDLHQKAQGLQVKLVRANAKNLVWLFDVKGSEPKPYRVKLKAIPSGNVRDINKMDVLVSCTCPYWQWQGPEHWADTKGYLYGKPRGTADKPNVKDPSGDHGACKHVLACLNKAADFLILHHKGKTASSVRIGRVIMCASDFDMMKQSVLLRWYNSHKED